MKITATVNNIYNKHDIIVSTNNNQKSINIAAKTKGFGSSVNGGELLFLALATCFCNDIYREAAKRKINITSVEVNVTGEFVGEGESASNIQYEAKIEAPDHTEKEIKDLIIYVDKVAEVHNTLRKGIELSVSI